MNTIKLLVVSKYIIKILENSTPINLEVFHSVDKEIVQIRDQKDHHVLLTADLKGLDPESAIPITIEDNNIQLIIIPKDS